MRQRVIIGEKRAYCGKLSGIVARNPSVIDSDLAPSRWTGLLSYEANLGPIGGGDGELENVDGDEHTDVACARQDGPKRDIKVGDYDRVGSE